MRIIPVIDLLGGVVVRGVAGRRSEYRPIESQMCASVDPAAIAQALVEHFGQSELYVADLDAIAGAEPAWHIYEQIAATDARLLVDAGVANYSRAAELAKYRAGDRPLAGVIAGLESVPSPAALTEIVAAVGHDRTIFSLDLKHGQPLTSAPAWQGLPPTAIVEQALAAGIRRLIVLDLADVGTGGGVGTLELCANLRAAHPEIELIAGGGVRGTEDLRAMAAAGCAAALVASALHDGRITRDMLTAI